MRPIAFLIATMSGFSQVPQISPVPPLQNDGNPPPELADKQFVYLDVQTGEYVISYPEGLDTGKATGRRITHRFTGSGRVDPKVSVEVNRTAAGFRYNYTLTNGPQARESIRWFHIVGPSDDEFMQTSHPSWSAQPPAMPGVAPQASVPPGVKSVNGLLSQSKGRFVSWAATPDRELQKSASTSGLTSSFRPGLTTAYASTGRGLALPENLPVQVREQIRPLMAPEVDYAHTLTVGPKFAAAMDDAFVANEWHIGMQQLIAAGRLSAESPLVEEIMQKLTAVAAANRGMNLKLQHAPSTQTEREVASTLELVFGSN